MVARGEKVSLALWGAIFALAALVATAIIGIGRVTGDGHQYYAMTIALLDTGKPFMTAKAWPLLNEYFAAHGGPEITPRRLGLVVDETQHFWFYSMLATCISIALRAIHADIGYSFTVVNVALGAAALYVCFVRQRLPGLLAGAILIFASPAIWYVDKAHTEFFTVAIGLMVVIAYAERALLLAALGLAVLSTQNLPFVPLAALCLAAWLFMAPRRAISRADLALSLTTVVMLFLQPIYYLIRLGVPHPQVLAGNVGGKPTLHAMIGWFIDPDVGLLPGWALGCVILAATIGLMVRRYRAGVRPRWDWLMAAGVFVYVVVCTYGQSSSSNYNHGAVITCSRYALWFIPLFYFPTIRLVEVMLGKGMFATLGLLAVLPVSVALYHPKKFENYRVPTHVSRLLYAYAPWAYDPYPEIFIERNGSVGDAIESKALWAVSNPSASKVVVVRENWQKLDPNRLPPVDGLAIDRKAVYDRAGAYFANNPTREYVYFNGVFKGARIENVGAAMQAVDIPAAFGAGWWPHEPWGSWSSAPNADVILQLPEDRVGTVNHIKVSGVVLVGAGRPCATVQASVNGTEAAEWKLCQAGPHALEIPLDKASLTAGRNVVTFHIDALPSPESLQMSGDRRALGFGLISITLANTP